jgi:DnaK suppressor protein
MTAAQDVLEEHRGRLRKELTDLGFDPDSQEFAGDLDRGFADSAHSTAERARLIALARELRENLKDVEHALSKVEAGTYGTCERCGNPIAPERLEAIPWARLCIDCKQKSGAPPR